MKIPSTPLGMLSASIAMLLAAPMAAPAAELLSNGSFDTTASWTVVPPQTGWTCIANGEAFLHPSPSGYVGIVIKQNLSTQIAGSRTLKFSAVLSKVNAPPGNTIAFEVTYLDGSAQPHELAILSPSNDSITANTPLSASVTLPAEAVKITGFNVRKTTYGMFTLQSVSLDLPASTALPEIVVQQPAGTGMTDGARRNFGTLTLGAKGRMKIFTIKNTGRGKLSGLLITKNGTHARDFVVTQPLQNNLAPGASTTFKVTFLPKAQGIRNAAIHIASNDADENPFDIRLTGTAVAP